MAIYHLSIKIISRGRGKSAVASSAYRSGEIIKNEYDGITHDYTRKRGIVHTAVILPDHAPREYQDRAVLWNEVEKIEKAKNSQLAREIELALPIELTMEQNTSLVHEYVKKHFSSAGMCADIAIHDTKNGNPHAHIMLTMRPIGHDGGWGTKQKKVYILDGDGNKIYDPKKRQYKCNKIQTTDWNEQTKAEEWRSAWTDTVNAVLEKHDRTERIDHRSYQRQGIDQIPTVHLGVAVSQMEKRGIKTDRGNINRDIEITNQKLRQLNARLTKLKTWLEEEQQSTATPTLADVITNILTRQGQAGKPNRYTALNNLKSASNVLNFITANNITNLDGLDEKLSSMIDNQFSIRDKLKPIERRLKVLDEHLKQTGNYTEFMETAKKHRKMKPQYQDDFYETHRRELTLFTTAENYLKGVMNGKTGLPIKAWKTEREKLTADKKRLNQEYVNLKNETATVEKIRSNAYDIVSAETRETERTKSKDIVL